MTDDTQLARDLSRAEQARAALDNEVLADAFATLEADYIKAWRETPARDTDGRERLWQAVQIVGKVKQHLQSAVNDGKVAAKEVASLARLGERRKILGVIGR